MRDAEAVAAREKYLLGKRLNAEESAALGAMVESVGRAAWTKHGNGESLDQEQSAWMEALLRSRALAVKRQQKRGDVPSEEDMVFAREWDRRRRSGKTKNLYYASKELLQQHEEVASQAGRNFSEWAIDTLEEAIHGNFVDPEYVEMLKARVEELDAREDGATKRAEDYRSRCMDLELQVQLLHDRILQFTERLMDGGPAAAKKWLGEKT